MASQPRRRRVHGRALGMPAEGGVRTADPVTGQVSDRERGRAAESGLDKADGEHENPRDGANCPRHCFGAARIVLTTLATCLTRPPGARPGLPRPAGSPTLWM